MNNLYKGDYHGFFKYKKENKNNAIYSNNNIYCFFSIDPGKV